MLLSLENIGLIKKSHIEVSGLTLIVGNNGVGKSTVSRALYATMRSFYHLPEKAVELKRRFTQDTLYSAAISSASKDLKNIEQHLCYLLVMLISSSVTSL